MSTKKRHAIRNSNIRKIVQDLKPKLGEEIENLLGGRVERAELDSGETIILVEGQPALIKGYNNFFPLISVANRLNLKRVTVDMGAVGPISDGADIMAPGVVEVEKNIKKGDTVGIVDEKNRRIIAIGIALKDGRFLKGDEGEVVQNLHHVGDKFWDLRDEF